LQFKKRHIILNLSKRFDKKNDVSYYWLRRDCVEERELLSLLSKMTLEEKVGQLAQIAGVPYESEESEITGPVAEMGIPRKLLPIAGSVLGVSGAETVKRIQDNYLKDNRLGIPLIFMVDVIHGFKTIFPIPLAIGASWDTDLAKESARIAAKEAAVSGVHVTFSPMVDLVRDPRWGRVMETTGEDKYLNERFAESFVRGYQNNNDYSDPYAIAACVKHFAGYGAPEGGRDYNTVDMSERQLREHYLSGYKAGIDVGAELVMTSFNTVDGIPATANKWLLDDVLRKEWGFDGVIITDWASLGETIPHGVAANEKEAAQKGIDATVDMEMMTFTYSNHLEELVEEGTVDEEQVDQAVLRILKLKNKLGLFENPYRTANVSEEGAIVFSEENRQKALETAEQSMVLLKNEQNTLPLTPNEESIALIGPFGTDENLLGAWSWRGEPNTASQVLESMSQVVNKENLLYAKGSNIEEITTEQLEEAVRTAEKADTIVLALGEHWEMSGEAASRTNIKLPDAQLQLIKRLSELNKPIVTVLFNGRPLDLKGIEEYSDAILEAWFPGTEGGEAVTNILFGKANPSGKLPMSFPENVGQVPIYYNRFNTGRPYESAPNDKYVSKYLDSSNYPKYDFGYGLSYSDFDLSPVELSKNEMTPGDEITASVTVTNKGDRAGKEVVQLYIRDLVGEVVRPLKELKGFKKIHLEAGESAEVTFTVTEDMLRYYHPDQTFRSDAGEFEVFINNSSHTSHTETIVLTNK